jgi:phage protein D
MPNGNQQEKSAPEFRIRAGGHDLPHDMATDVQNISVVEDLDAPGMFTFDLINWDSDKQQMKWSDGDDFAEGEAIEVLIGFRDNVEQVISGEITGLGLKLDGHHPPMFEVRGYDRRHRLMRGKKTRSFLKTKDSEIASSLASDAGLLPQTEDTGVTLDYVLQHNQTDFEFLLQRAGRIGYEMSASGTTLYFCHRRNNLGEVLTLDREMDLLEFHPRLTTMNQTSEYALRGWDVKNKTGLKSMAAAGSENTKMGGSITGPTVAQRAFGTATVTSVDRPVGSQAEADQIAKGRFNEMALGFISGSGVTVGNNKLRAGTVVKLQGLGKRFSGQYYVTATNHCYTPARGYRTAFTVRRNAE